MIVLELFLLHAVEDGVCVCLLALQDHLGSELCLGISLGKVASSLLHHRLSFLLFVHLGAILGVLGFVSVHDFVVCDIFAVNWACVSYVEVGYAGVHRIEIVIVAFKADVAFDTLVFCS